MSLNTKQNLMKLLTADDVDQTRQNQKEATDDQKSYNNDDIFQPGSIQPPNCKLLSLFTKLVIPNVLTNIMSFLSNVVIVIYAGRSGDALNIASVGLAATFCGILIGSLLNGMNAAQETLTSQAFGAKNHRLCGIYLNRGTAILTVFYVPLALVAFFFAE